MTLPWCHYLSPCNQLPEASIVFVSRADGNSPCCLEANWLKECAKFFHPRDIRAKAWSMNAWNADHSYRTVWIVRDSLLNKETVNTINDVEVELLSLFGDEAHGAFRSLDSKRVGWWDKMNTWSEFTCLISGTLFPLGPKKDREGLMKCLGRDWHRQIAKWTPNKKAVLKGLFDEKKWDILAFQTLITPFYLQRDIESQWFRKWIIPRIRVRPTPEICDPRDYEYEQRLTEQFRNSSLLR